MSPSPTHTYLRFTGDWPPVPVFALAIGLGLLMFFYYRRELRFHAGMARWVPALLRGLAVFLIVLCLAGPILRHVTTFRQLGRVILMLDASASMSFTDELPQTNGRTPGEAGPAREVKPALARFTRAEDALLTPGISLAKRLAEKHDVELFALRGYKAERLWWQRDEGRDLSGDLPLNFEFKPDATLTNLDQPLRDAIGPSPGGTALVLLTDGQHNGPGSPEDLAAAMGENGVPIFTVGYGSEVAPPDLALLNVKAPEAVFAQDRAEGVLLINDAIAAGLPAMASITQANKVLWQQSFTTTGKGERRMEFSFPVKELSGDARQSLRLLNVRVELTGNASSRDRITDNNQRAIALHLLTRKRKVLIMDGRPRWETRYLHNHFDRDERWEVAAAFDDFKDGVSDTIQAVFPKTREELMTFDLVVLGDLRPKALREDQQAMLVEFVEKRGGGLVIVDGHRGHLAEWAKTKAGTLIPVAWRGKNQLTEPTAYHLTRDGLTLEALRLGDTSSTNGTLWEKLPKAMWTSVASPQSDATVLARFGGGTAQDQAALVWRRYGAGSVLWLGTDEMWRWRYEVADMYHQRFWMQIASWIAAPPFLVENERVSLGMDRLRYHEGDSAELRVRLRDAKGSIVEHAKPRVHVYRNGLEIATLQLEPDAAHGGVFRAMTGALPGGDYQITVSEANLPPGDVKLSFRVETGANQEWSHLTLNRPLLEGMARASGGRFLREGDLSQLPDLLRQLDRQQTRVKETILWSSWWWFGLAMALLTVEWLLRKRWRLV